MLTRLYVRGFRTHGPGPTELTLAPLTVLVGPNGGGKSSLLEALALTAQSATEQPDLHNLVLSGDRIDLPAPTSEDAESIYFGRSPNAEITVGVEMDGIAVAIGPRDDVDAENAGMSTWPPARVEYRWTRSRHRWPVWSHEFFVDGVTMWRVWSEVERRADGSVFVQWLRETPRARRFANN